MSSPLQLSAPDGAQIHIYFAAPAQLGGTPAPADHPSPATIQPEKRSPVRLGVAALLLFGAGYAVRGLSTPSANAQDQVASSLASPPIQALPDLPGSPVLGSVPSLPSSIQVNPLPLPRGVQAGPYVGQPAPGYASPVPLSRPGMAVRAPYPPLPATSPAGGASAAAPSAARNPFGLE